MFEGICFAATTLTASGRHFLGWCWFAKAEGMKWDPLFSSHTDEWATTPEFFARLDREFHFTLDPCATPHNATCRRYLTRTENGLLQDWPSEAVFMNPSYGRRIGTWLAKAWHEAQRGATVVCLVPARTDTAFWHTYCLGGGILFIWGCLKFGGSRDRAPCPVPSSCSGRFESFSIPVFAGVNWST